MSLLLDTHVLVWSAASPEQLGKRTRQQLVDPEAKLFLSSITTLEIARLAALGQLALTMPVAHWCERARLALNATTIAVDDPIAIEAYALPGSFHPDPADRILVATARVHGLRIITADRRILAYRAARTMDAKK